MNTHISGFTVLGAWAGAGVMILLEHNFELFGPPEHKFWLGWALFPTIFWVFQKLFPNAHT